MKIASVKERTGSLQKLKSLLDDKSRKVHGVSYSNSFFTRRYMCRSSVLVDNIDVKDNKVKLTVATRIEQGGLQDVESTLAFLTRFEAGDIPGFTPEGMYDIPQESEDFLPEPVSVTQFLISIDILLNMKNPELTYKEFTIAGCKFTLVEIHEVFYADSNDDEDEDEDDFDHTVTLLFGEADKFSLLSHFYNKDLSQRDMKMVLDLFVDENLTGKGIRSIMCSLPNGVLLYQFPFDSLINSYTTSMGDYIFGSGYGYIRLTDQQLKKFKMECVPRPFGSYVIQLKSKELDISFVLE